MIDLHCHILPGVDDGPREVEEAVAVAQMAVADGVRVVVATPHMDERYDHPQPELIRGLVAKLNERLQAGGVPLSVVPGAEVRAGMGLVEALQAGRVMTLGDGGKYVLVELPSGSHAMYAGELFFRLQVAGFVPVVAHVERVGLFHEKPALLRELHERGCLLQVNAESLAGRAGWGMKRWAMRLWREGLVDVVASDGHNVGRRKPVMTIARKALGEGFERVTEQTPRRVLGL